MTTNLHAPRTLNSLQVGRAIAAIAVTCCHIEQFLPPTFNSLEPFREILRRGYLGVDFFFLLSGFIIYYSNFTQVNQPGWLGHYAWSRLTRIFVPYLPVGLAVAISYASGVSAASHHWTWLSSLTLLPSSGQPALSVAWTLQHELVFYGLMAIFLRFNVVVVGLACWFAAIAAMTFVKKSDVPGLSWIDIEFIIGFAAARIHLSGQKANFACALLGLLVSGAAIIVPFTVARLAFSAGLAMVILPILKLELSGSFHFSARSLFVGAASYSLYLVHVPVLRLASHFLREFDGLALFPLFGVVTFLTGAIFHVAWERPMLAATRRLFGVRELRTRVSSSG